MAYKSIMYAILRANNDFIGVNLKFYFFLPISNCIYYKLEGVIAKSANPDCPSYFLVYNAAHRIQKIQRCGLRHQDTQTRKGGLSAINPHIHLELFLVPVKSIFSPTFWTYNSQIFSLNTLPPLQFL